MSKEIFGKIKEIYFRDHYDENGISYEVIYCDDSNYQFKCEQCREMLTENITHGDRNILPRINQNWNVILILAYYNELLVGINSLCIRRYDNYCLYIDQIATRISYKRRGIARKMVEIAKDLMQSCNLDLLADACNPTSIEFFKSCDFINDKSIGYDYYRFENISKNMRQK